MAFCSTIHLTYVIFQLRQLSLNAEEVQSLRDDVDMWRAKVGCDDTWPAE